MTKNTFLSLAAMILLSGLILFSCATKSGTDTSTQAQRKLNFPDDPAAKKVHQILKSDQKNTYQSSDGGEVDLEEKSFVKITPQDTGQFEHFEVYNVYESDAGIREYYITKFLIDTEDFDSRQKIDDYQLIIHNDTVSETEGTEYEFIIKNSESFTFADQTYALYLLSNFGHIGAKYPDQYSVWSPECGIILSWFGEERWFKLNHSDYVDDELLAFLREKGQKLIEENKEDFDHEDHEGHNH